MRLENNIAAIVKERGVNLSAMARTTQIPYMSLYDSLLNENKVRQLRGRELIKVCNFLGIDPMDFTEKEGE